MFPAFLASLEFRVKSNLTLHSDSSRLSLRRWRVGICSGYVPVVHRRHNNPSVKGNILPQKQCLPAPQPYAALTHCIMNSIVITPRHTGRDDAFLHLKFVDPYFRKFVRPFGHSHHRYFLDPRHIGHTTHLWAAFAVRLSADSRCGVSLPTSPGF